MSIEDLGEFSIDVDFIKSKIVEMSKINSQDLVEKLNTFLSSIYKVNAPLAPDELISLELFNLHDTKLLFDFYISNLHESFKQDIEELSQGYYFCDLD